jgi:hypothetical protein
MKSSAWRIPPLTQTINDSGGQVTFHQPTCSYQRIFWVRLAFGAVVGEAALALASAAES